jgi:hypothetical protein
MHGNGLTGKFPELHIDAADTGEGSRLNSGAREFLTGAIPTYWCAFFKTSSSARTCQNKFSSSHSAEIYGQQVSRLPVAALVRRASTG